MKAILARGTSRLSVAVTAVALLLSLLIGSAALAESPSPIASFDPGTGLPGSSPSASAGTPLPPSQPGAALSEASMVRVDASGTDSDGKAFTRSAYGVVVDSNGLILTP